MAIKPQGDKSRNASPVATSEARQAFEARLLDLALRRAECVCAGLDPADYVPADPVFDEDDYQPVSWKRYGR